MAFDYKKEYKQLYMPKNKPEIVTVPSVNYIAVADFLTIDEGLCVQMMHLGAFDDEPATVAMMDAHLQQNGYENDFTDARMHHEIYLSDPRKVEPAKYKTVIRHPIKKIAQSS